MAAAGADVPRRGWLAILALGFIGYYLGSYLDLAGLQYISASLGRLILYLYPTVVLLLGVLFLIVVEGLKRIGANQVALVACIGPLATIGMASAFLGEPITAVQLVGAVLVLAGAVIISLRPQAAA